MEATECFKLYKEILLEGIASIKKANFKRISVFKDMIETLEVFINKEALNRIVPGNYLLLFILALGTRNPKMVESALRTLQRLFAHNYIHDNEQLSLNLMREDFREFLLVDPTALKALTVKQLYLDSLINLQEKDEALQVSIAKSISLVVRLFQHSLRWEAIARVYSYLVELQLSARSLQQQKLFKSVLIQIVRHIFENLREMELNLMADRPQGMSLKKICSDTLTVAVDAVVLRLAAQQEHGPIDDFQVVPDPQKFQSFRWHLTPQKNQKGEDSGKFGWCVNCRKSADYYCKNLRVPVCSFDCKIRYFDNNQDFERLYAQELRAQEAMLQHGRMTLRVLSADLQHSDPKRRVLAIDVFNYVLSEPKRFKQPKKYLLGELSLLFKQLLLNVLAESQAMGGCLLALRKLVFLGSFRDQIQLLAEVFVSKLKNIQTTAETKLQMLKFLRQIFSNEVITQLFQSLDCDFHRKNSVSQLLEVISNLHCGLPLPDGVVFEEDPRVRKMCNDIVKDFVYAMKGFMGKELPMVQSALVATKISKKDLDAIFAMFNNLEKKPEKAINEFVKAGLLTLEASDIADFLHRRYDELSSVQVGQFVGGHSDLCKAVLPKYIDSIDFTSQELDAGMRLLLDYFTLPSESQQVDRIIDSFSVKFYNDNRNSAFVSGLSVYKLSYLLMMLQSSLHNPQVQAHERMKLPDMVKLCKGMNQGADFPNDYLQMLYNSIQKTQLGFHDKAKQKEFVTAWVSGAKKNLADIFQKENQQLLRRVNAQFRSFKAVQDLKDKRNCVGLMVTALHPYLNAVLLAALAVSEDKDQVHKLLQTMQCLVGISAATGQTDPQANLFNGLARIAEGPNGGPPANAKQVAVGEAILEWAAKYPERIGQGWRVVLSLVSRFSRKKCISKMRDNKRVLVAANEKVFLHDGYVQGLFSRSVELTENALASLVAGLIQVSREEITDNQHIFCMQKIEDVLQLNLNRIMQLFPIIWPLLRDFYFEVGCNPSEKVALFGVDFLKQTVSKLLRKKQTTPLQKEFFRPYESIFVNSQVEPIKQFVVGSLTSIWTHNPHLIKQGWKVILNILACAFQEQEEDIGAEIKTKSYQALVKLIDSSLSHLDDYFIDLTQILVKLARQKEDTYVTGCLKFVQDLMLHFNKKLGLEPGAATADLTLLQTTWLPLLGILSSICGDHRPELQDRALTYLFGLLMDYGSAFSYEFWKMVFQGVLRPTFDEILYTFQLRSHEASRKDGLVWLRASCEKLFESISELISAYYKDFRLFLPDIFRIYENCTQNSNELLTKLSINAVKALVCKVAHKFTEEDWTHFLNFFDRLFLKTTPLELQSVEAWRAAKLAEDSNSSETYASKCVSQLMLLGVAQEILDKFSMCLSDNHMEQLERIIQSSYKFSSTFNRDLELRGKLWKEGLIAEMKQLPGLLKQERESLKCLILVEYYRYQLAQPETQAQKLNRYAQLLLSVFDQYIAKHKQLLQPAVEDLQQQENQRLALNMRILVRDSILQQLEVSGMGVMKAYRKQMFEALLEMLKYSSTFKRPCLSCVKCERCIENQQVETQYDAALNKLILQLFQMSP